MPEIIKTNVSPELAYISSMLNKTRQNHSLALMLFKKLFSELPEQIAQTENSLNANEMMQAQTIIHKLHGSVSFCGFTELQKLANGLEISLLSEDLPQAKQQFLQLKQALNVLQSLQKNILQQLENSF
jgi:HPt (histidine-containing phosphotransfer) domain-containing protein